jgi:hypothetical protein
MVAAKAVAVLGAHDESMTCEDGGGNDANITGSGAPRPARTTRSARSFQNAVLTSTMASAAKPACPALGHRRFRRYIGGTTTTTRRHEDTGRTPARRSRSRQSNPVGICRSIAAFT